METPQPYDPGVTDLTSALVEAIKNQSKRRDFCDVTVVVQDQEFQLHGFLLCAWSRFFRALFNSQMRETQDKRVTLGNISPKTFRTVLECIFEMKQVLTPENVGSVWRAADMLLIDPLTSTCEKFAMENCCLENCIEVYATSKLLSAHACEAVAWNVLTDRFDQVSQREEIVELSYLDVQNLVKSDSLRTQSEDHVIEFVLRWCLASGSSDDQESESDRHSSDSDFSDSPQFTNLNELNSQVKQVTQIDSLVGDDYDDERAGVLKRLLCLCRLDLASSQSLMKALQHPYVQRKAQDAKEILAAAVSRQFQGCGSYQVTSLWSRHRNHDQLANGLLWFKKSGCVMWSSLDRIKEFMSSGNLSVSLKGNRIGRLINKHAVAATILRDDVYMVTSSSEMYRFSTNSLEFVKITDLLVASQEKVCMCSAGNHVFVAVDLHADRKGSTINSEGIEIHFLPFYSIKVTNLEPFDSYLLYTGHLRNSPNRTLVYVMDYFQNSHHFVGEIPESPKKMKVFRTYKHVFFLFQNGSLWRMNRDGGGDALTVAYVTHVWQYRRAVSWAGVVDEDLVVVVKNYMPEASSTFANVRGLFNTIKFVKAESSIFLSAAVEKHLVDVSPFDDFIERIGFSSF